VRALTGLALCTGAVALLGTGCGAGSQLSCVREPQTLSPFAGSGSRISVRVGTVLYAIEAVGMESAPGFPWPAPTSSDPRVLRYVPLCRSGPPRITMEPERVTAFRAVRPGMATLFAPVRPAARSVGPSYKPYAVTVRVWTSG
jgi:hypothetical protein